ncbi:MAG TPA: isoprenylcysteine carboxylmethyltransferase family protein [Edaphobacter sp.]|nr:isoprenylcysteine carboxylmethyltransferase family protein [Edaphobacter sp.]
MKATALEFRLRLVFHAVIYVLGFSAPWDRWLHLDSIRTWQYLASWLARSGWLSFSAATQLILGLGILFAFAGAFWRTWASAYLGAPVVYSATMHGHNMVTSGPYRRTRNPLYLGIMLHTVALGLLMPPSGALVALILIVLFDLRLALGEEAFLSARLGEPYREYVGRVPRLLPAFKPRIPDTGVKPAWGLAFASEVYMWGVFVSFVALGWRYNSMLILQGVLVSLGLSLVMRAFLPRAQAAPL